MYSAASWFAHCYFKVCQSNTFFGAMTEVEKNHVRVLLPELVNVVIMDISGCEYHDPMLMIKFNTGI